MHVYKLQPNESIYGCKHVLTRNTLMRLRNAKLIVHAEPWFSKRETWFSSSLETLADPPYSVQDFCLNFWDLIRSLNALATLLSSLNSHRPFAGISSFMLPSSRSIRVLLR
jgi:hypothetical protein